MATNTKKRNRLAGKGKNKRPKSNKSTGRDYSYDKEYQKSPKQVKNRVKRNSARAKAIKNGSAKVGDNKDVDHIKPLSKGGSNTSKNTRTISRSKNRAKK
jgi:5-methylcytosine-specific restriction endonuclease McrA